MTDAEVAAAYDARATEYVEHLGAVEQMDPMDVELISRWRDGAGPRLLDAGCGPGHWTALLDAGERDALGIDVSAELLAAAQRRHPGLEFQQGTILDLPFEDAAFDGILAWYSLIHLPPAEIPAALRELVRVLHPGGSVLIGFFDGEPGLRFDHAIAPAYFWSADAMVALLSTAGLTVTSHARRPGSAAIRLHAHVCAERPRFGDLR